MIVDLLMRLPAAAGPWSAVRLWQAAVFLLAVYLMKEGIVAKMLLGENG